MKIGLLGIDNWGDSVRQYVARCPKVISCRMSAIMFPDVRRDANCVKLPYA
jgi:hypothetical protein